MYIQIKGAKENNLKNIDVTIPKNQLVVLTGLSGSGKSTLALETLQRECERQYMESMGMIMDLRSRPKVDCIEGLSPAISINQHHTNNNPRSNVGTVTEISAYLRVLYAKLGERSCPHCQETIRQHHEGEEEVLSEIENLETESNKFNEQMVFCPHCTRPVIELSASHFSFNKPEGACPLCKGIGALNTPDIHLLIDTTKSIKDFAITGWDQVFIDRYAASMMKAAKHYGFDINLDMPVSQYSEVQMELLLNGVLSPSFQQRFPDKAVPKTVPEGRFEGVVTSLMRRYADSTTISARQKIEKYLVQKECPMCQGIRFKKETLEVKVAGINIVEVLSLSLYKVNEWLNQVETLASPNEWEIVKQVVFDLRKRIVRIIDVGAGYLSLSQPASSLSAGEWQRIKLASVLGSGLTGVVYVLDEPTSGLHSKDTKRIIEVLKSLRDKKNTVIVIEHDTGVMKAADYIIDFGPGAGKDGGNIVACGSVEDVIQCKASITGQYLKNSIYKPKRIKITNQNGAIKIKDVTLHNLKRIEVDIPLGKFVTVTGVSGSGKSSLIFGCVAEALEAYFQKDKKEEINHISGFESLSDTVIMNQQSIGRSTRSNAATYTEVFTEIRDLYASLPDTKLKGLSARHFSYNVSGGRCEKCQGSGKLSISMHFLPDVEVMCPVCHGNRYQKPVLEITYKGYHISDVLKLSIEEALVLFQENETIASKLRILSDVGLGYLGLGQSSKTLSGGEVQRLKLAKELITGTVGRTLYLFDEPTTGLHPYDVERLIGIFDRLVKMGNSIIAVEHNTQMILESDWVIDLGPEGGCEGGSIVAQGSPEQIMSNPDSYTGQMLSLYTR